MNFSESFSGIYLNRDEAMKKRILILLLSVLVAGLVQLALAQGTGTIRGVVRDKETGEPLIGVNILIKGTYYGASTDLDGTYIITDIEPGEYTLELTYIGYKVIQRTGVKVEAGKTLTLNFEMEPSALALGEEIQVIGAKPLMDIEETSTVRSLSSTEIQNRIVNDALELVEQQVGIVRQDDAIHIRGGRSYEVQYLMDGISVQDPLSGTGFGLNISANAIEEFEVITGGFKAEYGQATSGIIKVKTKTGGDKMEGFFLYKSDHLGGLFRGQSFSFNTDQYEFSLGGPDPISNKILPFLGIRLPGKMYFFTNLYVFVSDDFTRSTSRQLYSSISPRLSLFGRQIFTGTTFAPRQNNNWSGLFKLTWKITPTHTLTYSYSRSLAINQNTRSLQITLEYEEPRPGFPYQFSKNLDNFNTYTHDNEQIGLYWKHTLNSTTFYELKFSKYFAQLRSDWMGKMWWEYTRAWDVPRLPVEYFVPRSDSTKIRVIPGDGFYDYGNASVWHDHYVDWYTIKGDITSVRGEIHTLKAGFEASFKEMQLIEIIDPWLEGGFGSSQDIYRVYPADGAFYVQDDIRFKGFYVNAGVRLDYWMPGKFVDRAIEDPNVLLTDAMRQQYKKETFKFLGHRFKLRLMPRIGVSFPISNNQMLYFNYGHFSKLPRPQFVYAKLGPARAKSAYQKFGNPNLNPETSVKYELGIRHKFTENDVISITAYYIDIYDYVQTTTIRGIPRLGSAIFYVNLDYARSRGIEFEYKTRIGKYFFGNVSGSYAITTTKSSSPDVGLLVAQGSIDEQPIKETYARWDRPWQFQANLSFRVGPDQKPSLFGLRLFSDWNLNLRFFAQAGRRYTPAVFDYIRPEDGRPIYVPIKDQAKYYSKIGQHWNWVDLTFNKYFRIWGMKYVFMLEIRNLLNQKNPEIINPVTGRAYEYGDPVPVNWNDPLYPDRFYPISEPYPLNPARYRAPRNIRIGFSVEF